MVFNILSHCPNSGFQHLMTLQDLFFSISYDTVCMNSTTVCKNSGFQYLTTLHKLRKYMYLTTLCKLWFQYHMTLHVTRTLVINFTTLHELWFFYSSLVTLHDLFLDTLWNYPHQLWFSICYNTAGTLVFTTLWHCTNYGLNLTYDTAELWFSICYNTAHDTAQTLVFNLTVGHCRTLVLMLQHCAWHCTNSGFQSYSMTLPNSGFQSYSMTLPNSVTAKHCHCRTLVFNMLQHCTWHCRTLVFNVTILRMTLHKLCFSILQYDTVKLCHCRTLVFNVLQHCAWHCTNSGFQSYSRTLPNSAVAEFGSVLL